MWGEPAAAEAGVTLHQFEVRRAFSRGSCPWITGPWQWWAAQAPGRGGVDSDLGLHAVFLVAAAAALMSHACLWWLAPVSGAPLSGALNTLSLHMHQETEARKTLLPLWQLQTFSRTPSQLAVVR